MKRRLIAFVMLFIFSILVTIDSAAAATYEGEGYETAKAAATAYVEAFNAGDVQGMISTFAIETAVENFDCATLLNQQGSYRPSGASNEFLGYPSFNDYIKQLQVMFRYGDVAQCIFNQYRAWHWPEDVEDDYLSSVSFGRDADAAVAFMKSVQAASQNNWIGRVELIEIFEIKDFDSGYSGSDLEEAISTSQSYYGFDEKNALVIQLRIDGKDCILCMDCVRYESKWYILSIEGYISFMLGYDWRVGGLLPYEALAEEIESIR